MFKDENRHYSLRKLSVGLASVLIGISFASMTGNSVHADTVESGSNSVQTVVKGSDSAIKTDAKDDANAIESNIKSADEVTKKDPNAIAQDIKQKATKGNVFETATKNATDGSQIATESTLKGNVNTNKDNSSKVVKKGSITKDNSLTANNNPLKDTVEADKQGLETSVVPHTDGDETTLNVNGNKAEVKESQNLNDPAKGKLKMATLMTTTGKKFNTKMLFASKVVSPANDINGGFDSSWGKLNVNDWKGNIQGDYYQLTSYTGDANHIIVPNEADFAKAGISTSGKQVGVTSNLMSRIFRDKTTAQDATVAFSKTDNKEVKAINADWSNTWRHDYVIKARLSRFDGTNLDVSNVTNMNGMFSNNQINDLSSLTNWKVDNVKYMGDMFFGNQISDLSPLANWKVAQVTDMSWMFSHNQISDLSPLVNWKVAQVTDMRGMFWNNQISDLSPLANWKVDNVFNMSVMFRNNQISDLSPLANWNVNNVGHMSGMFDGNTTTQTKNLQAKRVINFVYPTGYTGKQQDSVTQTVNVPTEKVKVELTTKDSKPSNNILDWVTKTETPVSKITDPVYFQDYTVPEIKGLLEPDQTVISKQQADITKPINVTVTYKLADSNTNDAYALDSKNELHEHINVNDNGGYDADFWGKINVDDWNYTVNGDTIEINGLKDGASTGANDAVIVPNLDDFKLVGKDGSAKAVYISSNALGETAKHKYYGLSKTNGNTFTTDSDISSAFDDNSNLTHADLNNLNTSKVTDMSRMFDNASGLKSLDVSNWNTGKVTNMGGMFDGASSLKSLDVSNWTTSKVTDMSWMFYNASGLTSLDVSNWDTNKVTNMYAMFSSNSKLALIVNGDKFADYLVKNNFMGSGINSGVKSVTTDNAKLLKLLTNDSQHDSATRTITFTFPANYSPDLTKYHLTKVGNTYQIKQSADYDKPYLQGTVLINATGDITEHHIDTTKRYELSDTWQPNYGKLVLAHKNSDGSVSFDAIQLPKIPGYKTVASLVNPARALFAVSFMALPKPVAPAINDVKPAKTVTLATPATTEAAKLIKTEAKAATFAPKVIDLSNDAVATTPKVIDLSDEDDAVTVTPKEATWQIANEPERDTYRVSNGKYTVELPHINNTQLHVLANNSTKDSVLFTYKGQNTKYVFNIKFANGHYLLTTYEIKSGKLVKLIDYNFIKSSKMSDIILDWLKL